MRAVQEQRQQQQQAQYDGCVTWSWVGSSSSRSHGSSRSWKGRTSVGDCASAAAAPGARGLGGSAVQRRHALTMEVAGLPVHRVVGVVGVLF